MSGFVICPHCATVNVSTTSETYQQAANNIVASTPTQPVTSEAIVAAPRAQPFKPKLFVIGGLSALTLLIFIGAGTLLYQNSHATNLLKLAESNIAKKNYETALKQLGNAKGYYSFAPTHRRIVSLVSQDKIWVNDNKKLHQATQLASQAKYDQAMGILSQINKDFPGYSQVQAVTANINQQLASARAVAAATKAIVPQTPATTSKPKSPQLAATSQPSAASQPSQAAAKRFTSTAAAASLATATSIAQAQQALQSFASQYNLSMEITSVTPSTYAQSFSYGTLTDADLASLKTYGSLFIDEWAKYPTDWVTQSKLKSIAIIKNFAIGGTHRAAGPDPFGEAMYYDATFSGDYAREVLHHEFDHLITFNDFGSYNPSDPTWQSYNPSGFAYGNGGASCYQPSNSCLTGEHPAPGFATGYAASAIEEDKAELYAYMMTGIYYHHLESWLPADPNLNAKVNNYKQFISSHSPEMSGSYFSDINP